MKTLKEKIEVMQAALDGKPIEMLWIAGSGKWSILVGTPVFEWGNCDYRIKPQLPSKIAEGCNPHNLTEEQVGVSDGWRLLTRDEVIHLGNPTTNAQWRFDLWRGGWDKLGGNGCCLAMCYRTRQPVGFFLPKPKKLVAMQPEDYPPVFWVRRKSYTEEHLLCVGFHGSWLKFASNVNGYRDHAATTYEMGGIDVKDPRPCEYSVDRKTWLLCVKEVDA